MNKRIISLLLCLLLCLSIFPAGAFAGEDGVLAETIEELSEDNIPEEITPEEIIPEEITPIEEAPAEEISAEETPTEEAPVEEPPAEEPIVEEPIVEEPPEEEIPVEESPEEEIFAEELPAEPVVVTFECAETADLSTLTVYDAEGAVVLPLADDETGEPLYGTYSLLPGEYSYSFSAEGFEPLDNQHFTVEDAALTVTIALTALTNEKEPEAETVEDEAAGRSPEAVEEPAEEPLKEERSERSLKLLGDSGVTVIDKGYCGDPYPENASYTLTSDGVLTIDGIGNFTKSFSEGYDYKDAVKSVVIKGTVYPFMKNFVGSPNLESVVYENGVPKTGFGVFMGCPKLTSVSIPSSIEKIDTNLFLGCPSLRSVTISEGVKVIEYEAFKDCTGLESITIPDSVTFFNTCVFEGCTSLRSVTFGTGLSIIPRQTFLGCTGLTAISIPGAMTVEGFAFENCRNLQSVTFTGDPVNPVIINEYAFEGCSSLTELTLPVNCTLVKYSLNTSLDDCNVMTVYYPGTRDQWYLVDTYRCYGHLVVYTGNFTVTFDANGGEGTMEPFNYSLVQTLPECKFTKEGYMCVGWNTRADGKGRSLGKQARVNGDNLHLYAQWATSDAVPYLDETGTTQYCEDYQTLDESMTSLADGCWYVLKNDVTIPDAVVVQPNSTAYLILSDDAALKLNHGLQGSLVIYGQSTDRPGSLSSLTEGLQCNLTVNGGIVNGISTVNNVPGIEGTVTVNGGAVTAKTDREDGRAIKGDVTVNGGVVRAKVECKNGYAISGDVTVNGGAVYAKETESSFGKGIAGIEGKATVNGGSLTASGDTFAIAGNLTVTGGSVTAASGNTGFFSNILYSGGTVDVVAYHYVLSLAASAAVSPAAGSAVQARNENGDLEGSPFLSETDIAPLIAESEELHLRTIPAYPVTVVTSGEGTASADKASALPGNKVMLSAEPAAVWHFSCWSSSDVTVGADNTFLMPEKAVTVVAEFDRCGKPTLIPGKEETCTEDGYKDCWQCPCGKYYEEQSCETIIADYEAWKTGAGKIPAAHSYGTPSYTWDENNCTATHTCTRCAEGTEGRTQTETVTGSYVKDTDATCIAPEKGHYTATFINTAFKPQSISVTRGNPLGHSYGEASYTWDDGKCTAARSCSRCAEGADGHSETETVTGIYTKEAETTCTEAEKGHYTATFVNTVFEQQVTSVTKGSPLGHDYRAEQYDATQHRLICRNNAEHTSFEAHSFHGNTCMACGYVKSDRYLIIYGANGVWTKKDHAALPFTSDAPFDKFASVKVDGGVIAKRFYTAEEGSTKVHLLPAYLETLSVGTHSLDIVSTDGVASTTFTVKAAPVYRVSFNMCGHGTQVPAQYVEKESTVIRPEVPYESGYTFIGWYADAAYRTKYDFNTPVRGDMVLYARWVYGEYPQTGDGSRIALWAALFSASGIALVGSAALRKKKRPEE